MNDIKYVLIVSQYYYSHHCFVVSAEEKNYREKALTLIEKLEDYKRDDDDERPYHYGSFREMAYTEISGRWNVNDAGDIYFIPCKSVAEALRRAEEFDSELNKTQWLKGRGLKAAQRKVIENNIDEHHLYSRTAKIVSECFAVLWVL